MPTSPHGDHIGQHIRDHVLPSGMSVTEAAKRLGLGRQALSNLLNGRASLSEQMALRLERAFGANGHELLELQNSRKRVEGVNQEREVAVRGYVPTFLTIKARDIEQWAASHDEARELLAVLLRKLIRETGRDLSRVDFPGYDNSQRRGWDGVVEARTATAWIQSGLTGWEFGAGQDPRAKAERDYVNRLSLAAEERARYGFVFVTPRNWPGKMRWVEEKEASGDGWKAVRAYDASDLEQWLEDAIATQLWFAERCLEFPVEGIKTLDRCWCDWSRVSHPSMSRRIFQPNIETSLAAFKRWLKAAPDRAFIVASDSIGETLAFVTCLFEAAQESEAESDSWLWRAKRDMAAVFESPETLQSLAESSQPFIPIAANAEVEAAVASLCNRLHCIVAMPRNGVSIKPDVALELLGLSAFHEALGDMSVPEGERARLERESGRSPTVLRRRLSNVPAVRTPAWSTDLERASQLIPMALVGAWRADREADREALSALADVPYDEIEKQVAHLLHFDDSPLWSIDHHRGVVSKVDALFAVAPRVTLKDIEDFLDIAEYVLSESDPARGLPEGHRWAAALYGKLREHSDALREGVRETLVMLAIHGDNLFGQRLGISPAARVGALIGRILEPLAADTLESQERDLPAYAEAAPETVLGLLEADLREAEPAVLALLRPTRNLPFTHSPRVGLLWALECMAWNPEHLSRVCTVLAQMARVRIGDNLTNKPVESLSGILRSWMPQTAAAVDERIRVLAMLVDRFRDVMWTLCNGEFAPGGRHAMDNYRPKWRGDATGAGGVATEAEYSEFRREVWRLVVSWDHDPITLGDLVERSRSLGADDQLTIWGLVDKWAEAQRTDEDRAALRERIRSCCLAGRGGRNQSDAFMDRARQAVQKLSPADPTYLHAWLFNSWVRLSRDDGVEDPLDWQAGEKKIDELRQAAMAEVWSAQGLQGTLALLERGNAEVVGRYAGACIEGTDATIDVLRNSLVERSLDEAKLDAFMRGFIHAANPAESDLLGLVEDLDARSAARVFRCAPFCSQTWRLLDTLPREVRREYWQRIFPLERTFNEQECVEIIDRLLEARRPRAAFNAMKLRWEVIDPPRLIRLMSDVATVFDEPTGHFPIDPYEVSNAMEALDAAPDVTMDQMASLEFAFIGALENSERGMPNLQRAVEQSPSLFVQAVRLGYLRDDRTEDLGRPADEAVRRNAADASHQMLDSIKRIPGAGADAAVNQEELLTWVTEARTMCAKVGRREIGDYRIGVLLSRASTEGDDWPCASVCEAMEAVRSEELAEGFISGKHKARGVVVGDPAPQDRALAATFRQWAERRRADFPFVSSVLRRLAASHDSSADHWDRVTEVDKRLGR